MWDWLISLLLKRSAAFDPLREAECSIGWQPSVFTPVFYGVREYSFGPPRISPELMLASSVAEETGPWNFDSHTTIAASFGDLPHAPLTGKTRIFFPSLDGSPFSAPILAGCGKYPLIVFAHGHCGEANHFRKWYELPATLARCGNVVLVPDLPNTANGTTPSANDADLIFIRNLITWARKQWAHKDVLLPEDATGLAGHSFGAGLAGRLVTEGHFPAAPHASLSGTYPSALKVLDVPKLLTWGTGQQDDLLVPQLDWETTMASPVHIAEFRDTGHWDYLPRGRSTCDGQRGQCALTPTLAADVVACFFGRYLPPERWANLHVPWWFPWFKVRVSLAPPSLLLTQEQRFFAGGHFASWNLLGQHAECGITLHWKLGTGTGSLTRN